MRSRWIWALALALGLATLAQAEDGKAKSSGNWFTRMLPWNLGKRMPKPKSAAPAKSDAAVPAKANPERHGNGPSKNCCAARKCATSSAKSPCKPETPNC
ncbi:MAG: hypothetical protein L0215_20065 [Gemmataceae bacterium]|nr:hypothetical protein [Gemmataceae bacterium]